MSTRYGTTREALDALLATWGEPSYRAEQAWHALYREVTPLEAASALPRALRDRLAGALPLALTDVTEATAGDGLTTKWLWAAGADRAQIETVLMRSDRRASVCVSSQAGCAMGCTFCATGQAGFQRHLDAGEIVEQVVRAHHASPQRVTNVVYMGMGEPLANYEQVWTSVERIHGDLGISARRITISTVGVVPGMLRLADETLPVSLHAPDDELRNELVPLNHRYPLEEVLDAATAVAGAHGRRVTFEYAGIAGVNDSRRQAAALGERLARWPGVGGPHVNLIPLNPTGGYTGRTPAHARLRAFADVLRGLGVSTTIRRNRGVDIDAACGQLRARTLGAEPASTGPS